MVNIFHSLVGPNKFVWVPTSNQRNFLRPTSSRTVKQGFKDEPTLTGTQYFPTNHIFSHFDTFSHHWDQNRNMVSWITHLYIIYIYIHIYDSWVCFCQLYRKQFMTVEMGLAKQLNFYWNGCCITIFSWYPCTWFANNYHKYEYFCNMDKLNSFTTLKWLI